MQAEKPKRNRFRNLVPSTSGASQHPRGIGPYSSNSYIQPQHKSRTISRQHSIQSQSIDAVERKIRLRTVGSLDEVTFGLSGDRSHADIKLKRHRELASRNNTQTKNTKYEKLLILAQQFKGRIQKVNNMSRQQLQNIGNLQQKEDQDEQQYEIMIERTKISATKLILLYLNRCIKDTKKQCIELLSEFTLSEQSDSQNYLSTSILPISAPSQQNRPTRRNLMNVNKFLQSK